MIVARIEWHEVHKMANINLRMCNIHHFVIGSHAMEYEINVFVHIIDTIIHRTYSARSQIKADSKFVHMASASRKM